MDGYYGSIDGSVLSDFYQIDYYKNNKIQYSLLIKYTSSTATATIQNVSVSLPAKATNGLNVFDYDNTRNTASLLPLEDKITSMKNCNINGLIHPDMRV